MNPTGNPFSENDTQNGSASATFCNELQEQIGSDNFRLVYFSPDVSQQNDNEQYMNSSGSIDGYLVPTMSETTHANAGIPEECPRSPSFPFDSNICSFSSSELGTQISILSYSSSDDGTREKRVKTNVNTTQSQEYYNNCLNPMEGSNMYTGNNNYVAISLSQTSQHFSNSQDNFQQNQYQSTVISCPFCNCPINIERGVTEISCPCGAIIPPPKGF